MLKDGFSSIQIKYSKGVRYVICAAVMITKNIERKAGKSITDVTIPSLSLCSARWVFARCHRWPSFHLPFLSAYARIDKH